jgi:hypothetical protein
MVRNALVILILVASTVLASAQAFNPATPVTPSPPPPPIPPYAQPGMGPVPPMMGRSSASDPGAARPGIGSSAPARETHNDRSIRCAHQAGTLGVPAGARGQYVRECVNN